MNRRHALLATLLTAVVTVIKFYQLLGGGLKDAGWQREHMSKNRLAILPNLTHYEAFSAPALTTTVLPFLNNRSGAAPAALSTGTKQ